MRAGDTIQAWPGFWVSHDYPHEVNAAGIDSVFVWSESLMLRRTLKDRAGFYPLDTSQSKRLVSALHGNLEHLTATDIDRLIANLLGSAWTPLELDPRVQAALTTLQASSFSDEPTSLAQLAAEVGLSPSRLRHLFRSSAGLSLQRYRLWRRLFLALQLSAEEGSLTRAAHAAGFADSSHLSRVFRASFGFKPSLVLGSRSVQVIVYPDL